jgi:hypothetical protein
VDILPNSWPHPFNVAASDWLLMDVATPYEPYVGKPLDQYACSTYGPDGFMDLVLYLDRIAVGAGEDVIRIIKKQ